MKKITVALLALISLFTISCEIGLGAAVDTEPPSIEIQTPPVDSVIRDKFAIAGTWSDDGSIDYVKIQLDRTDGYTGSFEYAAEVKTEAVGKGSWTAVIDPVSDKVIDGSYQATVTIADTTGRKTIRNLTFNIDNTAPIVVLQRPSSIISSIDSETDTYGQIINLTGQAADDNNINTIEMNFYSDEACTTLLNTVTLNNVPATINLDVAKFVEKSENDYSKIYGYSEKKGTVTRYCKIVAYDGAQSYPIDGSNQTAEDTRGNKQENYYLYDDISTAVLSNHKITELYSMFNGTYALSDAGRSAEAADVTAIKKLLESKQNSKGKFNLNPANNPTFLLSGRSGLKKDGTDFYSATNPTTDNNITNDSTAIIEVSPGLDGISLNGDSIKVYIVECNQYGNPVDDVRFYPVTTKSKSGTGYKFVSTITNQFASANGTKKLTLGKYYLFGVEGADQNGNPIVPNSSGGYGFYFAASGAAPRLESKLERSSDGVTWTEIKDQISYLPAGTKVRVSGKVSVENGMPEFTLKLDSVDSGITFTEKTEAPFEYTFEKVYEPSAFGTESAQHSISITAIQSGGKTEKAYTVMYDLDGPVITVSEISPIAYKYTDENGNKEKESDVANAEAKKYLNGSNVSIKISITDNYDIVDSTKNKAKIEIFEGTNIAADAVAKQTITGITTPSNFKWDNINTNEIAPGEITIRVTAYDRAGNETVWENTTAETPSRYFVDQTTDNPIILPSSASELSFAITAQNSMGTKNKFTSGGQLLLKLIDDDGLKSITPYEGTAIGSQTQKATVSLDRTAKETLYSYYLPTQAGFHYLRFELKDSFDNIKSVGPFIIKISAGAPAVTEIDSIVKNKNNVQKSTSYTKGEQGADADYFENTVKFTSEYASVYVYRSTDGENFTKLKDSNGEDLVVSCTPVAASYEYKDKVKPTAETTYHYYFAGIDGPDEVKGNSQKITCKVDKTAPTLVELKALPGKEDTKATQYTFTGTAKDEGGSGIDKVYLTISDGSNSKTVEADGSTSWSYDLNYADTEGTPSWMSIFGSQQGDKYVYIKAVDAAGNESTTFKYSNIATYNNSDNKLSFLYDNSNPTLNITNAVGEYMPSTGFTFEGTANDTYSVDKLEVTQVYAANDENPITTGPSRIFTKTNITPSESWTCKVPLNDATPAEGTYTYTFTLTDKKGNTVTSRQFETKVDNNAPTLTITTPSTDTELKGEDSISDEMFQFEGEITEANSMSGVYYKIVAAGTNGTASTTEPSHPVTGSTGVTLEQTWTDAGFKKVSSFGTTSWKTRQNFHANDASNPAADSLGEGKNYTLYVYGVDKAGNVSTAAKRIFDVDKSKPEVAATSTATLYKKSDLDSDSLAGEFTINGTARDTYDLTSVQLSYVSEANLTPVTLPAFTLPLTNGEWTKTFRFGSGANGTPAKPKLDDGIYTFTIKATDKVGKVSTAERKITVDTNPPVITASSLKIDSNAYDSAKWYESKTLPISIEVSDGTGSGIAKVQVSSTAADASDENWRSLSLLEGVWTGTVQFDNDGGNNFWIRAKDIADNDYAVQSFTIKLDTSAPKIYLTKYYVGDVEQEISGTVYINDDATKTLTLYGQYYDNESGVKALSFAGCNSQPEIWYSADEITGTKTIETINWTKTLPENTESVKYWKAKFANSALKTEDLIAVGRNNAGSTGLRTDTTLFTIALDRVPPTLSQKSITLMTDSTKYSVYKSDDNYYVNNTDGKFIISGLAEDKAGKPQGAAESDPDDPASGVAEVRLSFSGLADKLQPDPSKNAYFKDIDLSSLTTGSTTATIKVIDKAGNESDTINLTIVFDTQGPNGIHLLDKSTTKKNGQTVSIPKDLYFRVGDQKRDDFVKKNKIGELIDEDENVLETDDDGIETNAETVIKDGVEVSYTYTGAPAWDSAKDKDVGGKYSGNTFGNAETIKLRGKFEDKVSAAEDAAEGSGVSLIYYKIFNEEPTESNKYAQDFLINYSTQADGYFSLLKEPETRRVFYTDDGTGTLDNKIPVENVNVVTITNVTANKTEKKYYTDITTNYKTTIANLKSGANFLVLVAVDNVGNAALEGVEYNNKIYNNYRINVDYEFPEISVDAPAIGLFTNASEPLVISGHVADKPDDDNLNDDDDKHAGIKSVWLKYNENDKDTWIPAIVNESTSTWTATVPVDTLNSIYGTQTTPTSKSQLFTATATDYSGKGNSFSCNFTVTIDKEKPTVGVSVSEKSNAGTNDADVPYVNGSIKLKGSASDLSGLAVDSAGNAKKLSLWYRAKTASDTSTPTSVSSTSGWIKWETDVDNNTEWTIDTTGTDSKFLSANESSKIYYFIVEAKDRAGNSGYSKPLALNIDKDSDRPTAKFYLSFEDNAIMPLDKSELDGVISDDDGTPEKEKVWYYISYDSKNSTGALVSGDVEPNADDSKWIDYDTWKAYDSNTAIFKYNESTGSFTFRPNDGTAYIWLKIQDKGGNTFITSNSTTYALKSIKISDQTGARILGEKPESGTTVDSKNVPRLKLKKDTIAPLTDSFAYLAKDMDETKEASANQGNGWSSSTGSAVFGGTSANTFRVRIYAYDVNGIAADGVQFKIPVESSDIKASSVPAPTQDPDDSTKSYYVYTLSKQNASKLINQKSYDLYWSGDIDVTGFVSGQRSCIIDTFDGTKHKSESISFNIDNEPPEATVTSHNAGDQIRAAFNLKGGFKNGDAGTTLKYILLTSETAPDKNDANWTSRENVKAVTSMSWQVNFDGLDNSSSQENTHDGLPKKIIADLLSDVEIASSGTNEGKAVYKTAGTNPTHAAGDLYKTITTVYFHMLASDAIGNSKVSTFSLKLDPQGDIPTIKMDYPAYDSDSVVTTETATTMAGLKYAKLSGNIRAQGSAEDDKNIVGIYMQIDTGFNMKTGKFDSNWETKECPGKIEEDEDAGIEAKTTLSDFGYTIEDMYTSYNAQRGDKPAKTNGPRGIRVGSSSSWNITLNSSSEFNSASGAYIAIKFYAVDEDGNISIWDDDDLMIIYIDSDAPKIGSSVPLYVYQYGFKEKSTGKIYYAKGTSDSDVTPKDNKLYTDADCKTEATAKTYSSANFDRVVLSSMEYKKNMWLKGEWWLSGSIEDESGINDIKMKGTSIKSNCGSEQTWNVGQPEETKGYIFNYKVGSTENVTGYGTLTYALWAEDGQAEGSRKPANLEIAVQYDNKPPTLASTGDADYSIPTSVVNEQGFYKVQSSVTERDGESGFDKVFFYFKRGSTVYDAYIPKNVTGNELTGLTEDSNIYWKTNTVTAVSANVITVTTDDNIHKGGLVKVGGTIYTITGVSGTSVTLSGNPPALAENETMPAYFAIGHVVDHIGTEGESGTKEKNKQLYGYGYYKNNTEDDGDLMLEKVSTVSTKTLWYGLINSRNIPDGAIEIHYVAFDKAGNMAHDSVSNAKVENNGPRLASLRVWTDYNGNNSEDGGESDIKYYNRKDRKISGKTESRSNAVTQNLIVTGNDLGIEAGASAFMRVTDKTRFYPEIVGGNGALYYSYKIGAGATPEGGTYTVDWSTTGDGGDEEFAGVNRTGYVEYSDISADYMKEDENNESYVEGSSGDEIEVGTSLLETVQNGLKWFEYTIWDSTEGGTKYTDTLNAKFTVLLNVAYTDETKPTADITPFHWTSKDDNSIAWEGSGSDKKALGHIELEGDLTNEIKNVTVNTTKMGDDPKVSGQIIFEGTASDDIRLKEIHAQFTDHKGLVADTLIGTYTPSTGEWTGKIGDGWSSTVENVSFGAYGHTVHWRVTVDTAVVGTGNAVAALDRAFTVYAIAERGDTAHNKSDASTTQTTTATKTPYYKVDVVPYISNVETSISTFLSKDYMRSAVGDYPIKLTGTTGETIKVSGFNLSPTNTEVDADTVKSDVRLSKNKIALSSTTKQGTGLEVDSGSGTDAGKWLVTMSAAGNGYLTFFTNGIPSLNNVDSEADYNKEESLIHASLNNDRKFTLWDFTALRENSNASKANGATYPSMAMNGDTPQFAYVNNVEGYGLAEFWNGTTETKIYENWDLFTYTSLALNSNGKRAALYDINVVFNGTGNAGDSGGIMTNFFYDPSDSYWGGSCHYFRKYNVWMDGLYKNNVTAVLNRYHYPTIKMLGNDSISHVFYSTYDAMEDRVLFRYFTVGTNRALVGGNTNGQKINNGNTNNVYLNSSQLNQVDQANKWPDYSTTSGNAYYTNSTNTNARLTPSGNNAGTTTAPQVFAADSTVGLYTATAGVPITTNNGNVTAARAILVYYAGTNMYYTYATNNANTQWSTPVVLDSNCEASYISMVVDSANHVHIAYQNNIAGDVKYIYIPTYSDPATRKTVTVDSYLTVGDKLTLDVVGSTPYIGYKGLGNTAKVAWYVANNGVPAVGTLTDGINSEDKFTGSWNVEIIPNRIVDSDTNRFNVGVGRTNNRPVIGYSNNQSGSKGIEYLTRTADLNN